MNETANITGKLIRECRENKSMTIKQLAAATGISVRSIEGYELGERRATLKALEKIAPALKVPVGAFI